MAPLKYKYHRNVADKKQKKLLLYNLCGSFRWPSKCHSIGIMIGTYGISISISLSLYCIWFSWS